MADRVLRSLVPRRRWAWGLLARLIFVCQRLPVLCARLQLRLSYYACMRHPGLLLLLHISDLLATSTTVKSSNDERRASPWSTGRPRVGRRDATAPVLFLGTYHHKETPQSKIAMAQTATADRPADQPTTTPTARKQPGGSLPPVARPAISLLKHVRRQLVR